MKKRLFYLILWGAGGIFLTIGTAFLNSTLNDVRNGVVVEGVVTEIVEKVSRSGENGTSRTYAPEVRFVGPENKEITFEGSGTNPPSYHSGEHVEVIYNRLDPYRAHINSFSALYLFPLIFISIGSVLILIPLGVILYKRYAKRKDAELKKFGKQVAAKITGVNLETSLTINGQNPYRVSAQWFDSNNNTVCVFESENMWYDPSDFLKDKISVDVYIDLKNPKRYYMDLSFLPKEV